MQGLDHFFKACNFEIQLVIYENLQEFLPFSMGFWAAMQKQKIHETQRLKTSALLDSKHQSSILYLHRCTVFFIFSLFFFSWVANLDKMNKKIYSGPKTRHFFSTRAAFNHKRKKTSKPRKEKKEWKRMLELKKTEKRATSFHMILVLMVMDLEPLNPPIKPHKQTKENDGDRH